MAQQYSYRACYNGGRGLARQALQIVGRAADAARHEPSPALHAFVSLRQAVAHAQLGDEVAFRWAITAARRELDRGPHETDPPWTRTVSDSEITVFESIGKEELGATDQAAGSAKPPSTTLPNALATRPVTGRCWQGAWWQSETSTRRSTTA
jgi:hypothetical protein